MSTMDYRSSETTNVSQGTTAFQRTYSSRSIDVSKTFRKRSWNVRAERNRDFERYGSLKLFITLVSFLAGTVASLTLSSIKLISLSWLAVIAVCFLADGLHFWDRWYSKQSRSILASECTAVIVCIAHPAANILVLGAISILIGSILIKTLNSRWLSAENWLMTEIGQAALQTHTENRATESWQAHGKREVRSIMYSLGIEASEDVLDVVCRAVWLSGYMLCWKLTDNIRTREEHVDMMRQRLEEHRQEIIDLKNELQCANRELKHYRNANGTVREETNMLENRLRLQRIEIEQKDRKIADLLLTNEDLMQGIKNEPAPQSDREKAELISQYKQSGVSQNDAGRRLGMSPATTSRLMQRAKKEGWV
jgi:hypothetical protein